MQYTAEAVKERVVVCEGGKGVDDLAETGEAEVAEVRAAGDDVAGGIVGDTEGGEAEVAEVHAAEGDDAEDVARDVVERVGAHMMLAEALVLRCEDSERGVDEVVYMGTVLTSCTMMTDTVLVAATPQLPMDAVAGLKRFLPFGKKNGNGADSSTAVVIVCGTPPSAGGAARQ
ncbi:hypothetical protein ZWY2020_050020 [Hordeum vulgare]|nr:hypothetical protein ZWY2020_050020 [Hordeum vulgare]